MSTSLLTTKDLSVNVEEKEILHNINLEIGKGETHVLMGPNGTGKSTLGYALMGNPRYQITNGKIYFNGTELQDESADKRAQKEIFLSFQNPLEVPDWGPSIDGLNMEQIVTYVRPNTKMTAKWSDVPQDIKDTFEKLGIPQAERKSLAGVGAQYDSELVYHNVRSEVAEQGVVYTDMESALKGEYADMVRKHFMKLVTPRDHKFAALHGAV